MPLSLLLRCRAIIDRTLGDLRQPPWSSEAASSPAHLSPGPPVLSLQWAQTASRWTVSLPYIKIKKRTPGIPWNYYHVHGCSIRESLTEKFELTLFGYSGEQRPLLTMKVWFMFMDSVDLIIHMYYQSLACWLSSTSTNIRCMILYVCRLFPLAINYHP